MKYYILRPDYEQKWVFFPNNDEGVFISRLSSESCEVTQLNKPVKIEWIEEGKGEKWLDIHESSPNILVLSKKAVNLLKEYLNPNGFLLPTSGLSDDYCVYNTTNVVRDAFDFKNSVFIGKEGHVSSIKLATLNAEKILSDAIFKICESRVYHFVSESFKNTVITSGLTGFVFEEVTIN